MADRIQQDLAHRDVEAVVVTAPAGAGKTRLAREVAATWPTAPLWVQASTAVATVPLGAIADVVDLEGLDGSDAGAVFRRVEAAVAAAGGVVVVDDAPHLDGRTADVLRRVVAGGATVLATARTGETVPAELEWLWLGERTRHLELDPLDVAAILDLVERTLPAGHDRSTLAAGLAERTGGNALFLRELVTELARRAAEGEALVADAQAPPHLQRVLEARLDAAGPSAVEALRAVATLGSLPRSVLVDATGAAHGLDVAERDGWVTVDAGTRAIVRPTHPLYAEAALGSLTASQRHDLVVRVATCSLDDPGSTATDRLRATAALVDVGAPVTIERVVEAARTAFAALDHELAVRLAEVAVGAGDRFEARIVLGAAHSGAGRPDAAEAALRDALREAVSDDERARSVGRLSVHLVAHGGRIDEAAALLDEIEPLLADPAARSFVAADRAKLASIRGDLTSLATPMVDEGDDLARLNAAIVGAYALAMSGDAAGCRATVADALPLADAHREVLPWSGELVRFSLPFAALLADGPRAAVEVAAASLDRPEAAAESTGGTWRFLHGFALTVAGALDAAAATLGRAELELDGHDLISARPLAIAAHAWALAQGGDVTAARERIDASVGAAALDGRVDIQVRVADAWCDVVEQGPASSSARSKLLGAAADATDGAQALMAALVLHELVRIGGAADAIAPLQRLEQAVPPSWLVAFVADRARADAAGDAGALERLARRAAGRWPLAEAELHASRHVLALAAHDEAAGACAAFDAYRVLATLGPTRPWTLAGIADPLTERERQVATAVAAGHTNRSVADQAGVSVRTVENQLQSVYRKLGLSGRAALPELFTP